MGAFLSQIMSKLLGGEGEAHAEVDHNTIVCCGSLTNVMEPDASDNEKDSQKERKHGN